MKRTRGQSDLPDKSVTIDLIVVNYFSSQMIGGLLKGVERNHFRTIVLVDNSDDSDEFDRLESLAADYNANALQMDGNVGFGAAVNRGVEYANPDPDGLIWILNPDTKPDPHAAKLLAESLRFSEFDMISPLIVTGEADEDVWFGGGRFNLAYGRTEHLKVPPARKGISFITGAALMVRADSWNSLRGFREDLFMYWEDADLSLRAAKAGMQMGIEPSVRLWHAVGATSNSTSGRSELFHYYMQRNRIRVLSEHFGVGYLFGPQRVIETAKMGRRALIEKHDPLRKVFASVRGIVAGGMDVTRRRRKPANISGY